MPLRMYKFSKRRLKLLTTLQKNIAGDDPRVANGEKHSAVEIPALHTIGLHLSNMEKHGDTPVVKCFPLRSANLDVVVEEKCVIKSNRVKMSRLTEDDEIQQKIEDQIRMRDGVMKLVSALATLQQALEVSKSLLTINARVLGLMSTLQRARESHVLGEFKQRKRSTDTEAPILPCVGRISLEDIRIPLMWKDNVHFTGKTGDQAYYAFALVRCGDQVRDTSLYQIQASDTDVYFEKALVFENVGPDFKMELELYYTVIQEGSWLRAPIFAPNRKQPQVQAPKFCLAGHVQLNIDDVKKGIISKDLYMGSLGATGVTVLGDMTEFPPHPLELWGQICCSLAAQPHCMTQESLSGYVNVEEFGEWKRYFCSLHQCKLRFWLEQAGAATEDPVSVVVLKNAVVKEAVGVHEGYEMGISVSTADGKLTLLAFDDSKECHQWLVGLRTAVLNLNSWKWACNELMAIQPAVKLVFSAPATGSFYDQIEIGNLTNGAALDQVPDGPSLTNAVLDATLALRNLRAPKMADATLSPLPRAPHSDSQSFPPLSSLHPGSSNLSESEVWMSGGSKSAVVVPSREDDDVLADGQELSLIVHHPATLVVQAPIATGPSEESSVEEVCSWRMTESSGACSGVPVDCFDATVGSRSSAGKEGGVDVTSSGSGKTGTLLPSCAPTVVGDVVEVESLSAGVVTGAPSELHQLDGVLDDSWAESSALGVIESNLEALNPTLIRERSMPGSVEVPCADLPPEVNLCGDVVKNLELIADSSLSAGAVSVSHAGTEHVTMRPAQRLSLQSETFVVEPTPVENTCTVNGASVSPHVTKHSDVSSGINVPVYKKDEDEALNTKVDHVISMDSQATAELEPGESVVCANAVCADPLVAESAVACVAAADMSVPDASLTASSSDSAKTWS